MGNALLNMTQLLGPIRKSDNHINWNKIQEPGMSLYDAQSIECQILNFDLSIRVPFTSISESRLCGEAEWEEERKELTWRWIEGVLTDRLRRYRSSNSSLGFNPVWEHISFIIYHYVTSNHFVYLFIINSSL